MSWRLVDVVAETPLAMSAVLASANEVPLSGQRFAVRCSRLAPEVPKELTLDIARRLGHVLEDRGRVDLTRPEVTVRVLLTTAADGARRALIGTDRAAIDRGAFEARHVEERPFFSPISMHPRLARALVNLGRALPGQRVWDPFCGTGGIALEAAIVGSATVASDIDPKMVAGTRATLGEFGAHADVRQGDVAAIAHDIEPVHAIVTDPPYGRASSTHREEAGKLYGRFFEAAHEALAPQGRVVVVLPNEEDVTRARGRFDVLEHHAWHVHGTLTRHVYVLRRTQAPNRNVQ
jgi:tRNA (guanine10-N2)-dimethyltransferase